MLKTCLMTMALTGYAATLATAAIAQSQPAAASAKRLETKQPAAPKISQTESQLLLQRLKPADDIKPRLATLKENVQLLAKPCEKKESRLATLRRALAATDALDKTLINLRPGLKDAELRLGRSGGEETVDDTRDALGALRAKLNEAIKSGGDCGKLGEFDIQDLMSRYNQSETLASSVQKKVDDTASAVIGRVG